jgi:hypothetical protein
MLSYLVIYEGIKRSNSNVRVVNYKTKTIWYVGRPTKPGNILFVSEEARMAEDCVDVIRYTSCLKSFV